MWRGGNNLLVLGSCCLWCMLAMTSPANAEEQVSEASLADGQFYSVSQPAPGAAPAAPLDAPATQPPARPRGPSAPQPSAQARAFGGARGPQSSAPSMIGDFFGSSRLQIFLQQPATTINTTISGFAQSQNFNDPRFPLLFAVNPSGPPVLISGVPGIDASGDKLLDTWPVPAANVPPQFEPVAPEPGDITFSQGSLVFTQGTGMAASGRPQPGPSGFAPGFQLFLSHIFQPAQLVIDAPSPGGGGGVGRVKIAENNSPLPRDRVFHNFSYFDNVPLTESGVNVNRFIPGFEKTFFGGIVSVEMRFPFAATLDSEIVAGGVTDDNNVEFGNIGIPLKVLLYQNPNVAFSTGLQISLPTADDTVVQLADGTELVRIENEAVHLMPFIGLLLTPNDRLFMQGFVQIDADTAGSPVSVTNFSGGLISAGRLDDVTFLFVDVGAGYWLHRSRSSRGLTGLAPTLEVHYNTSLGDAPSLDSGPLRVVSPGGDVNMVNLVLGTMFEWNQNTTLTVGYATPLTDGFDQEFDGELRVIFNHRFGPQTRASRAQF
jgi:hypothetical protein